MAGRFFDEWQVGDVVAHTVTRTVTDEGQVLLEQRLQAGRCLEAHRTGRTRSPRREGRHHGDAACQPASGGPAWNARHRKTAQASRW